MSASHNLTKEELNRIHKLHEKQENERADLAKEIGFSVDVLCSAIRHLDGCAVSSIFVARKRSSWLTTVSRVAANKRQRQQENEASGTPVCTLSCQLVRFI